MGSFHLAYTGNLVSHPHLGYLAAHVRALAAGAPRARPGASYTSGGRDVLYVASGIGRIMVGKDVVDVFSGAVVQIDGGMHFQLLPGEQPVDVRRIQLRR